MKASTRWNAKMKYEFDYDELIIRVGSYNYEKLTLFLKDHYKQRIVIDLTLDDMAELLNEEEKFDEFCSKLEDIQLKYYSTNFTVRFPSAQELTGKQINHIEFKMKFLPHYYNTVVDDWDKLCYPT